MYLVPVRYQFVPVPVRYQFAMYLVPGQVGLHYCVSLSSSIWQIIIWL